MMILHSVAVAILAVSVSAQSEEIVKTVGDNWSTLISCAVTFGLCYGPRVYRLTSTSGDPIRLYCPQFKTIGECVKYSDGKTATEKCGQGRYGTFLEVEYVGQTSEITVSIPSSGAFLSCNAKTIHSPRNYTVLELSPSEASTKIDAPQRRRFEATDDAWRFKTSPGSKISLTCTTNLATKLGSDCVKDALTIDTGNGSELFCGEGEISVNSTGTEMTMRLETSPNTRNKVSCDVKAVKA